MSNGKITIGCGNITFSAVLFFIFLILKLTAVIDWSWWWITAPLWISGIFYAIIVGVIVLLFALFSKNRYL